MAVQGINKSTNEILFQCEEDILLRKEKHTKEVLKFIADWTLDDGEELHQNFSHDNWTGIYAWCKMFKPDLIKELPLFGHFSLRTDNFAFYFWAKFPILGFILGLPIAMLSMIIGMLRVWRTSKTGDKYIDTDGKLLAYFKTKSFNMRVTRWLLNLIIKKHKDLRKWKTIFDIYYKDDHPVWIAFNKEVK